MTTSPSRIFILSILLLLCTRAVNADTFSTSFEFSNSGTFPIGVAPLIASFSGGSAQTVGNGAYYHSGAFSWHVPSGGTAEVNFETAVEIVDFWFRDTAGAASSSYRIYDTDDTIIGNGSGSQTFVNIELSRTGSELLIARIEFESAGGGDTVVDDFSFTATEPTGPSTTITIDSIADDTGASNSDFITNDGNGLTVNATLSAALAAGERLEYSSDNGSTWSDISGSVSGMAISHTDAGLTSTNTIQMRVVDAADNNGAAASQLITIDTTAPTTTVSIDSITTDSGSSSSDFITNDDDSLTIAGTLSSALAAGEILEYSNDNGATWSDISGSVAGTAVTHADATLTTTNTIQMRVTDTAGNSGASATQLVTIDTTAPTTTVSIDSITDDTGTPGDFITNDNDGLTIGATLSAGLAAGEVLEYTNDNGATWSDISGSVAGTVVTHADATLTTTNTIQMRVTDTAGNSGSAASQLITINTAPEFDPANPIASTIATSTLDIELDEILTGLVSPVWATTAPGRDDYLYIVDQVGIIIQLDLTDNSSEEIFDLSTRLVPLGAFGDMSFDERGFLGLAFHPNYMGNGLFFTYTSEPVNGAADFTTLGAGEVANHQSVIAEWQVIDPMADTTAVDADSRRELLRIDQPQFNHDGGNLAFGHDGHLFISLGDGGNADDEGEGHGVRGNARDITNPLGSLLRIDPLGNNSSNGQYGIPTDNPLIGQTPVTELYAYGFRNPYRFSFDMVDGELWLADVGQNSIEEIDQVSAGENHGWNHKEGSFFFEGNGNAAGSVTDVDPGVPEGLVDPVAEYDHDDGIAIIGGFVYRGSAINQLVGRYIFGDFGSFDADAGRVFYLDGDNTILALDVGTNTRLPLAILGFGQDAQGEVYVLTNTTGTPFDTTGSVYKIVPPPPPPAPDPPPPSSSGSSGGGCFIATVFWGDYDAPAVMQLRQFRDKFLTRFSWGKSFIHWYYTEGPKWAAWFEGKPAMQALGRYSLYPLVLIAAATTGSSSLAQAVLALCLGALIVGCYRRRFRAAGTDVDIGNSAVGTDKLT